MIVEINNNGSFRYDGWLFSRGTYELVEEEQENKVSHIAIGEDSMLKVICDKLGVAIGERWLADNGTEYQIGGKGELFYKNSANTWVESNYWTPILSGEIKPKWRPKNGEKYYTPDIKYIHPYNEAIWYNVEGDKHRLKHNLVFKTKEEAIDRANQILEMIMEGK